MIAAELANSAASIVKHGEGGHAKRKITKPEDLPARAGSLEYARDIALLIGNRKFCRHVVMSAPGTARAFFIAMSERKLYQIPLGQFAKNVTAEAILNKDSLLYHEDDGYTSGLIGYLRPFSNAIFGDYELVEALVENGGSPFDIDYRIVHSWNASQLEAYTRALLLTYASYLKLGRPIHSTALNRALSIVTQSFSDTYKINEIAGDYYSSDPFERLSVAADFVKEAVILMDKQKPLTRYRLRLRGEKWKRAETLYDRFADVMFELLFAASGVTSPPDKCWTIHHNIAWSACFESFSEGKVRRVIEFKLQRLLYDEIRRFDEFPNYKSARILGICLNVMGLVLGDKKAHGRNYYSLKKATLNWTKHNFSRVMENYPDVAEACLIGGISFDKDRFRLVKTYAKGRNREAPKEYLDLIKPTA